MLFRASAAVVSLLFLVGAVGLLLLGSAAVIRTVLHSPGEIREGDPAYAKVVGWAHSLRQPAWKDEEDTARDENLNIRVWSINCKLVSLDDKGDLIGGNPLFDKI